MSHAVLECTGLVTSKLEVFASIDRTVASESNRTQQNGTSIHSMIYSKYKSLLFLIGIRGRWTWTRTLWTPVSTSTSRTWTWTWTRDFRKPWHGHGHEIFEKSWGGHGHGHALTPVSTDLWLVWLILYEPYIGSTENAVFRKRLHDRKLLFGCCRAWFENLEIHFENIENHIFRSKIYDFLVISILLSSPNDPKTTV